MFFGDAMVEISVIMPVYNCEDFLDESINSILNQTFGDFEFICVDDGSTDRSLEMLEKYEKTDDRMVVYSQENQGGGIARNFALTKATGKYIYFMDADDAMDLTAFEETYKVAEEKNPDFLLFKAINYNDVEDRYYETEYFSMNKIYDIVGDELFHYKDIGDLLFRMSVTPWGKLYNRQFIMDTGAEFASGMFHDNKFFWKILLSSEKLLFYNKSLYVRRIHPDSLQSSHDKKLFDLFGIMDIIFSYFRQFNQFEEYRYSLYNYKIDALFYKFYQVSDDLKQEFLDRYKTELLKIAECESDDTLKEKLNRKNRGIYEDVLESETYREFILLQKNRRLTDKISGLESQNRKLKKLNDEILNSKSWKITEPLRKIRNR